MNTLQFLVTENCNLKCKLCSHFSPLVKEEVVYAFEQFKKDKEMNVNDWKKEIMSSPLRAAVPVMTHPGIEMLGHNVKEAVCSGQIHFEAVKALCEKYPQPAAMTAEPLI